MTKLILLLRLQAMKLTKKSGRHIKYNPFLIDLYEDGYLVCSRPTYIGLAHELIHCLNEQLGIANAANAVNGWYWGMDKSGTMSWLTAPVNELKVVGLPYLIDCTPANAKYRVVEIHQETTIVGGIAINENAIRAENNIEFRKNYL